MKKRILQFPGFRITIPGSWRQETEGEYASQPHITLDDPQNGVGALQISSAIYRSGKLPQVSLSDLSEMLAELSKSHSFGDPLNSESSSSGKLLVSGSYHWDTDFVKVWYLTDRKSLLLITYTSAWEDRNQEVVEAGRAVQSIEFI